MQDISGQISSTKTVDINVIPINDDPTNSDLQISTTKNTPVTFDLSSSDVDIGDTIVYSIIDVSNGTCDLSGQEVRFNPAADFTGNATITYNTTDASGGTGNQSTVNISVLSRMATEGNLTDGSNELTEDFVIIYDLTKTYDASNGIMINHTLTTQTLIRTELGVKYDADSAYYTQLSSDDYNAVSAPTDLSRWRAPYIDSDLYKLNIDSSNNTWQLRYNEEFNILSGTIDISGDTLEIIGAPIVEDSMIEFPVSKGGLLGVPVVDENGNGVSQFNVNATKFLSS